MGRSSPIGIPKTDRLFSLRDFIGRLSSMEVGCIPEAVPAEILTYSDSALADDAAILGVALRP